MTKYDIFTISGLIVILICLLFFLIRISKYFLNKNNNVDKSEIFVLILILLFFILVLPWFFSQAIFSHLAESGQIGAAIGGITAPFINAVGAVLVYIAFKEQVNSSKSGREEKRVDLIIDNINKLDEDHYSIKSLCENCISDLNTKNYNSTNIVLLTRILREFQNLTNFTSSINQNKDFLENKIYLTWKLVYEDEVKQVNKNVVSLGLTNPIQFLVGNTRGFNELYVGLTKEIESYN